MLVAVRPSAGPSVPVMKSLPALPTPARARCEVEPQHIVAVKREGQAVKLEDPVKVKRELPDDDDPVPRIPDISESKELPIWDVKDETSESPELCLALTCLFFSCFDPWW